MKWIHIVLIVFTLAVVQGCKSESAYPDCSSKDIELMDTCLLGQTIGEAIESMAIDSSDFIPILRFARDIGGIYVRLSDTCKITIIVEKPYVMTDDELAASETNGYSSWKEIYKYIENYEIVGICWRKNKARKVRTVGNMKYHACWDY